MRLLTETYTLPAHWASSLINGDDSGLDDGEALEILDWLKGHPWLGNCLDCKNEDECSWGNDANDLLCTTAEFTFSVHLTRESGGLKYLIYPATPVTEMLPWQKAGLSYTATGYGRKIPTTKVLYLLGRRYRIYVCQISNAGTAYITYQGEKVIVE